MESNRRLFRLFYKHSKFLVALVALTFICCLNILYNREVEQHQSFAHFRRFHWELKDIGVKQYPMVQKYERWDWHNYDFMIYEAGRQGNGEQGRGVMLTDPKEFEIDNKLEKQEGLHVVVSDKISVNRSLPDTRPEECQVRKYLMNLPETSIIIIFFNEWPSILKRTIHSVYNRTPRELLKEIILVNDNSTKPELNDELDLYLKQNFDDRVKMYRLNERKGLIVTRLEGAKRATGEVLVFLDSHIEVNNNWLPPLLEPIAMSPTTVTLPTIDHLNARTFQYKKMVGSRGIFDEFMWYQWFPLLPQDAVVPDRPYQIPIMLGCAFAIRRDYFYDLGQYDEGLQIWNGEQIELSLKLHLCGGELLKIPCSRLSHTFRSNQRNHNLDGVDVAARNFKRVAEVWLDEYKEVLYRADPDRFGKVDAGDLTKAKLVREKLKCKPFQYFLERIAPEMYTRYFYQAQFPGYFAWGGIRSDAFPRYCLDFMQQYLKPIQLYECSKGNLTKPSYSQFFKLTWHKKLRHHYRDDCLQDNLVLDFCRYEKGREYQNWKYDIETKQLVSLWKKRGCLTAALEDVSITLSPCNATDVAQKWTFGSINEDALRRFDKIHFEGNTVLGLSEH